MLRLLCLVLLLVASASAASKPINPYLQRNTTVCPGFYTPQGFLPCGDRGACDEASGQCVCLPAFRGADCSYELRSRHTAFVLSFLLGTWGAGQLYLGLIGTGVLELLVFTMLVVLPCFPLCCMCVNSEPLALRRYYRVLVGCCVLGMVGVMVLWTTDWLFILLDSSDAYGWSLQDDLRVVSNTVLFK